MTSAAGERGSAPWFRGGDQHAARADLWSRLDRLTRAQRAVLVLRCYEDLDDRQIGEVLRCATSTVRVHAARAWPGSGLRPGRRPGVCLSVAPAADEPVEGDPVTVGGRAARLAVPEDGATVLSVFLPAGRVLSIEVNQQDVPMSRAELIRFGEGVAVAG